MVKITLTRKEAAELLGISISTVTQWVMEGRLKAYRVSDKPKSPYLFTTEDCQAAVSAVPVQSRAERSKLNPDRNSEPESFKNKRIDRELDELLKTRTKGRGKD